ncbi:uncharacterized protein CCR75_007602 [Bremia lactucae]|uniref:Uncharacterized protein n=1 Tax=Bremia lactucae TaxID=4779 RepID=A0A976IJT8_BRELC|nr:hypothetical protein CCR75_007602 [Bremia lactucae]
METSGINLIPQSVHVTTPSKKSPISSKLFVLCATLAAAALLIFFIFYPILDGQPQHCVYLLQLCLGIGLLQKSWWHYRIRQRFLAPMEASLTPHFRDAGFNENESDVCGRMEPSAYAVTFFIDRYMGDVRCAAVIFALLAASIAAAVAVAVATYTEDSLTVCAAVGCFSGMLCACFAPTPGDGVSILVQEGALTMTAMNSIIVNYTGSELELAIVDYLFVALVGWVIIVISRIIASKKLLKCLLMVALDTTALLHVTIVMMEIVHYVNHPLANTLPHEFSAFIVTIACAESGHYLFSAVTTQWLRYNFDRWIITYPRVYAALDLIVSVMFSAAGMSIWMQWIYAMHLSTWSAVALIVAAALSYAGRSIMTLTYETAMVLPWYCSTFTVWNNGMMELLNPFLVGWIIFNPYIKNSFEAEPCY